MKVISSPSRLLSTQVLCWGLPAAPQCHCLGDVLPTVQEVHQGRRHRLQCGQRLQPHGVRDAGKCVRLGKRPVSCLPLSVVAEVASIGVQWATCWIGLPIFCVISSVLVTRVSFDFRCFSSASLAVLLRFPRGVCIDHSFCVFVLVLRLTLGTLQMRRRLWSNCKSWMLSQSNYQMSRAETSGVCDAHTQHTHAQHTHTSLSSSPSNAQSSQDCSAVQEHERSVPRRVCH